MSRDHRIRGERYVECALCGFIYRISDTALNDAGLRVCKAHDLDKGKYRHFHHISGVIAGNGTVTSSVVVSSVLGREELNTDGIVSMGWWDISSLEGISVITEGYERDLE